MRVLEQKPVLNQTMGKKKHKLRKHSKDNANFPTDSSDESHQGAAGPRCGHLSKSINISAMRKSLKQLGSLGQCTSCSRESSSARKGQESPETAGMVNGGSTEDLMVEVAEPTLWVCLQCGHLGCDRNSKEKHGLKHFQTPRSASHAVVVNTTTWAVWCYSCDDECPVESSRKLGECVDLLRRLASGEISQTIPSGRKSATLKPEIPVTVAEVAGEVVPKDSDEREKSKSLNRSKSLTSNPFSGIPLPKVYGLSNLGNTCFFNAVMQNLSHTYILRDLLTEYGDRGLNVCLTGYERLHSDSDSNSTGSSSSDDENEEKSVLDPLNLTLPEGGALTKSMVGFLGEMKLSHDALRSTSNNIVNPGRLFGQICKKTPRFKGFQQQDSHELLRHLLEGMKSEEIKRSQGAILKAFNLPNAHPKKVDEDTKLKIKEYGRQVKHTFVDSVFGGYFISTVLCEECHEPSQIFEPFQDISLPILEDKPTRPNNLGGGRKKYDAQDTKTKSPEPPLTGVDGFAAHNRPSKHQSRKSKKQSKKESKKKLKNKKASVADTDPPKSDGEEGKEEEEGDEEEKEGQDEGEGEKTQEDKENSSKQKEEDRSNEEWDSKSDADVEDNIESDVSRKRAQTAESQDTEEIVQESANTPPSPVRENQDCEMESTDIQTRDRDVAQPADKNSIVEPGSNDKTCCDEVGALGDGLKVLSLEGEGKAESVVCVNGPMDEVAIGGRANGCHRDDVQEERKSSSSPDVPKSPKAMKPNLSKSEQKREMKLKAMQTLAPRNQPAGNECSVTSCLNQFTAGELLTGNNKFGCERCTRRKYNNQDSEGKRETVYTNASKQLLVFIPPAILTLHLKRFQQVGFSLRKVNRHVDFPLDLDLAPYCSALSSGVRPGQTSIRYSLYGVVEHSGRLTGGHYTAYVKVRTCNNDLKRFLQFQDINGLKLHKVLEMMKTRSPFSNEKSKEEPKGGKDEASPTAPGKWYYMSDTRVSETSESNVLRCQAYILFYERVY